MPAVQERRNIRINYHITDSQQARLERRADECGMGVGTMLRWKCLDPSEPPEPPETATQKSRRHPNTILVTPAEKRRIAQNAEAVGLSISEWVRRKGLS